MGPDGSRTKMTIATGIIADEPTANLNIYPREVLNRAIIQFNHRARKRPVRGSEIDPLKIDNLGDPSFIMHKLLINESGMLCADIEILEDTPVGKELLKKIHKSERVVARPVMCVPAYVDIIKGDKTKIDPLEITDIHSIVRVQVECG